MIKQYTDYKNQLAPYGLNFSLDDCGVYPEQGNKFVKYPCYYIPDANGTIDIIERSRTLYEALDAVAGIPRHRNPEKSELPSGAMPKLYIYNFHTVRKAVNESGGRIYLVEGDKDVWTLVQAGIKNAAAFFSASEKLDAETKRYLDALQVREIIFLPDADDAGHGLAKRVKEFSAFNPKIVTYIKAFPFSVNDMEIKDSNDLYVALNFNDEAFISCLEELPELDIITDKVVKESTSDAIDFFKPEIYDAIIDKLGLSESSWTSTGFSRTYVACPFGGHPNDHINPKFQWNRESQTGHCFKCAAQGKQYYLTKEVATALGIDWKKYLKESATSNRKEVKKELVSSDTELQRLLDALDAEVDVINSPLSSFAFSLDDLMVDYATRLKGETVTQYPPLPNLITPLSKFLPVLKCPQIVGFIAPAGAFKTTILSTIALGYVLSGYDGILWSPEWEKEEIAARFAQQVGSLNLVNMALLEQYYQDKNSGESETFGVMPDNLDRAVRVTERFIQQEKGDLKIIDAYGSNILNLCKMIIRTAYEMRQNGKNPRFAVLDYIQLAEVMNNNWTHEMSLRLLKRVAKILGIVIFVSTQARKSDIETGKSKIADANQPPITETSGLGVRSDSFTLLIGLYPIKFDDNGSAIYVNKRGDKHVPVLLYLLKNSLGASMQNPEKYLINVDRMLALSYDKDSELPLHPVFNMERE